VETIEKTTYQPLWQKAFKIKKALQVIGKLFTGFLQTSCTFVQATQLLFSEAEYNLCSKIHISLEF
jgi:hypothetical protein